MKPKISYVNLDAKYRSKEENLNYDKRRKFINQVVILDELSENLEALEELKKLALTRKQEEILRTHELIAQHIVDLAITGRNVLRKLYGNQPFSEPRVYQAQNPINPEKWTEEPLGHIMETDLLWICGVWQVTPAEHLITNVSFQGVTIRGNHLIPHEILSLSVSSFAQLIRKRNKFVREELANEDN